MTTVRHLLRDDDLSPAEQRAILAKAARPTPSRTGPSSGPRSSG